MDFGKQRDEETEKVINKSKKLMIVISVVLVLLMLGVISIIFVINNINQSKFKVYINNSNAKVPEDTFVITDNNIYVSIKDFATLFNYTFNNGEYKHQYSEDTTKCFITNNSEIASYSLGSSTLYKTLDTGTQKDNVNYEYFDLSEPVRLINNKLYTTLEGICKGCNVLASYDRDKNTMVIFDLTYLTTYYSSIIPNSVLADKNVDYTNLKATLYDLIVTKNETTAKYGVKNTKNEVIIGEKYKSISFLESANEFIVTTDTNKVGIIASDGKTQIEPQYDSIKQIDASSNLYLVGINKKYGIVDETGKILLHIEYDKIGIDSVKTFTDDDIENPYLLYGECIPVCKNNKWGLLSKNESVILPIEFDELGCVMSSSGTTSLLLIPEYKAIVVRKDKFYGLYNSSGIELIPARVRNMYSVTNSGKKSYYLTYDERYEGETLDIIDYLTNNVGIKPIEETNQEIEIKY